MERKTIFKRKLGGSEQMDNELDKWSKVHERARAINEFIDYLNENKLSIGKILDNGIFTPPMKTRDEMIYECYDIDPIQLEQERRSLLKQAVEKARTK